MPKKTIDAEGEFTEHHGWMPTGFPPDRLAQAAQEHEVGEDLAAKDWRDEKRPGAYARKPWSADAYMNAHKPTKGAPRGYQIQGAAEQCAEMLKRSGWPRVHVEEIKK